MTEWVIVSFEVIALDSTKFASLSWLCYNKLIKCPRSSEDRALASGARRAGSSPAGGTFLRFWRLG